MRKGAECYSPFTNIWKMEIDTIDAGNAAEKAKARRVQALLCWLMAGFIASPLVVYWLVR
jgi:hypothetical protein